MSRPSKVNRRIDEQRPSTGEALPAVLLCIDHRKNSPKALLFRFRREMAEHLLHFLVEVLGVLIWIVRKCVAGRASPD
jgi:hypothetical protein